MFMKKHGTGSSAYRMLALALCLGSGALVFCSATAAEAKGKEHSHGKADDGGQKDGKHRHAGGKSHGHHAPSGIYVRITPFALAFTSKWTAPGHDGQDILHMIKELRPDVLNRFITGKPKTGTKIAMGGGQTMGFTEYLTEAMRAGAPGCYLTPKVHLNKIWTDEYRMGAAKALRELKVTPRLHALDLDCYFSGGGKDAHKKQLHQFKEMGWQQLGFNYAGQIPEVFGMASYGMAAVSKHSWKINTGALAKMKKQGVKTPLVHIDYPKAIAQFGKLPPDRQADIILKYIAPQQKKLGFRFVYPILYSGYDSTKEITRKNGKYKGASLFELMKRQIEKDRRQPGGGHSKSKDAKSRRSNGK